MLKSLIDECIKTGINNKLFEYLTSNSNLPGPRGNLELANKFSKIIGEYPQTKIDKLWKICTRMTRISTVEAPVNTSKEFIPFCGTIGICSIATKYSGYFDDALSYLQGLACDSRWRMREAVAMGLQKLMTANEFVVLEELKKWIGSGQLLALRAVVAGVAEPALLNNNEIAKLAFQLNQKVVKRLIKVKNRKTESFRVLRKALAYTLSVVIVPLPKEGFEYLKQLININDPDITWIVKENLKKNRLIKKFPNEVTSLKKLLN